MFEATRLRSRSPISPVGFSAIITAVGSEDHPWAAKIGESPDYFRSIQCVSAAV